MIHLTHSPATTLSLQATLDRLARAPNVDGVALFGSHTATPNPVSDYDLLILVPELPMPIFQMLTHIDGCMADVVFVDTATADTVLGGTTPGTFEWMFLQKMTTAHIRYDVSGRLERVQSFAQANPISPPATAAAYPLWFWHNHLLYHLKRMAQADDAVYRMAVDLMLMSGVSGLTRDLMQVRGVPWQGEKAALRYMQTTEPAYFNLLQAYLMETDRWQKIDLYGQLIQLAAQTEVWSTDVTAVFLRDMSPTPELCRLHWISGKTSWSERKMP